MPVCITGMHRSGTSLVANLLYLCGLYLGEEADLMPASVDNQKGYWENKKFVEINNGVLKELGASWNSPPPAAAEGWAEEERFRPLRLRAEILLQQFAGHQEWGWKDPRNSVTLPFWAGLNGIRLPFWTGAASGLKVIICLRNPLEVYRSLRGRSFTPDDSGIRLWLIYNRSILNLTLPEDRIITHYEAYFDDAASELRRVLNFLNLPASEEAIERHSRDVVSEELRHNHSKAEDLLEEDVGAEVFNLYLAMCDEAHRPQPMSANVFD